MLELTLYVKLYKIYTYLSLQLCGKFVHINDPNEMSSNSQTDIVSNFPIILFCSVLLLFGSSSCISHIIDSNFQSIDQG